MEEVVPRTLKLLSRAKMKNGKKRKAPLRQLAVILLEFLEQSDKDPDIMKELTRLLTEDQETMKVLLTFKEELNLKPIIDMLGLDNNILTTTQPATFKFNSFSAKSSVLELKNITKAALEALNTETESFEKRSTVLEQIGPIIPAILHVSINKFDEILSSDRLAHDILKLFREVTLYNIKVLPISYNDLPHDGVEIRETGNFPFYIIDELEDFAPIFTNLGHIAGPKNKMLQNKETKENGAYFLKFVALDMFRYTVGCNTIYSISLDQVVPSLAALLEKVKDQYLQDNTVVFLTVFLITQIMWTGIYMTREMYNLAVKHNILSMVCEIIDVVSERVVPTGDILYDLLHGRFLNDSDMLERVMRDFVTMVSAYLRKFYSYEKCPLQNLNGLEKPKCSLENWEKYICAILLPATLKILKVRSRRGECVLRNMGLCKVIAALVLQRGSESDIEKLVTVANIVPMIAFACNCDCRRCTDDGPDSEQMLFWMNFLLNIQKHVHCPVKDLIGILPSLIKKIRSLGNDVIEFIDEQCGESTMMVRKKGKIYSKSDAISIEIIDAKVITGYINIMVQKGTEEDIKTMITEYNIASELIYFVDTNLEVYDISEFKRAHRIIFDFGTIIAMLVGKFSSSDLVHQLLPLMPFLKKHLYTTVHTCTTIYLSIFHLVGCGTIEHLKNIMQSGVIEAMQSIFADIFSTENPSTDSISTKNAMLAVLVMGLIGGKLGYQILIIKPLHQWRWLLEMLYLPIPSDMSNSDAIEQTTRVVTTNLVAELIDDCNDISKLGIPGFEKELFFSHLIKNFNVALLPATFKLLLKITAKNKTMFTELKCYVRQLMWQIMVQFDKSFDTYDEDTGQEYAKSIERFLNRLSALPHNEHKQEILKFLAEKVKTMLIDEKFKSIALLQELTDFMTLLVHDNMTDQEEYQLEDLVSPSLGLLMNHDDEVIVKNIKTFIDKLHY